MKQNVFDPDFQNQDLDARIVSALERVGAAFRVMLWRQSYPLSLSPIQAQIL
ncbi:MAG: MarR family transcriptional regulator, partial [Deltaproteobacteria bacterium]